METHIHSRIDSKLMIHCVIQLGITVAAICLMFSISTLFLTHDGLGKGAKLNLQKAPCKESLLTPHCPRQ